MNAARRIILATAAMAAPLLAGVAAEAQVHGAQPVPPRGSYQQSCLVRSFDGRLLSAQCNGRDGLPKGTSLDITPCGAADIENQNGELRCSTGPVPSGAWRNQCADAWVYGTELRAYCRVSPTAAPVFTSLEHGTCVGPISVVGTGRLSCDQGRPIPPGSYRQTCVVTAYSGHWLNMECKKLDGTPRYNNIYKPAECFGDIYNEDGFPKCSRGGLPPAGSYTASCARVLRDNDKLEALCKTANGLASVPARLASIAACRGADIFNDNGALKCNPAAAPAPAPAPAPTPMPTLKTLPMKPMPGTIRGVIY